MRRNEKPTPEPGSRFSPGPNRAREINWRSWDDPAFAEAQQQGKLIFLAIGAIWCHWCHVMDETTYSDSRVIKLLNTRFIPIRVDTDQRPDVNRRYNQGGWPSFAVLVPTGEVLIGGTYITPAELNKLLGQVLSYHASHADEVQAKIEEAHQERERIELAPPPGGDLTGRIVGDTLEFLKDAYDQAYGGFDRAPKFPQVESLDLLLENYHRTREQSWLDMVTNTLNHMVDGGLFDKVAGGFFRYSTKREWAAPHYEKMLEENARLISLLLKTFQLTGDAKYEDIARRTISYLDSTLLDNRTGCFFGSQDADEKFYLLHGEERKGRRAPYVDPVTYTDWNAQAAVAYLKVFRVLGEDDALQRALHILDFLWSNCRREGNGMYHYWDGRPNLPGCLPDQVHTAAAMLEAYEVTGKLTYLQRAEKLSDVIERDFYDEKAGGFFDLSTREVTGRAGRLLERDKSIMDNAAAAEFFLDLYVLTDKEMHRTLAGRALRAFLDDYQQYGLSSAAYTRVVDHFLQEPVKLTIVGGRQRASTHRLLGESLKVFAPATVVEHLDPERDSQRILARGYAAGPIPAVYVCHKKTCSAPIERAEDVGPALSSY